MAKTLPDESWGAEYWRLTKVLLLDCALFLTILAILLIVYLFAKILESAGYGQDRIQTLETVHFYVYLIIQVEIGLDLIGKFSGILMGGKKRK